MFANLKNFAEENNTILCFGIDPDLTRMIGYNKKNVLNTITEYFFPIIDKLLDEHQISAIKPNYAYFSQYGFDGLNALKSLMDTYKSKTMIILDAKRGDIGKSSKAYSREIFDFWGADATTISPYMGEDSMVPLIRDDKLTYVLCKTSNPGSNDFQNLTLGEKKLYLKVAEKAMSLGAGLVVGATQSEFPNIVSFTNNSTPLLIPGIGAQGGNLQLVMESIKTNPLIHKINSSSSIAYAHEKYSFGIVKSALSETELLNKTIRKYLGG